MARDELMKSKQSKCVIYVKLTRHICLIDRNYYECFYNAYFVVLVCNMNEE